MNEILEDILSKHTVVWLVEAVPSDGCAIRGVMWRRIKPKTPS